MSKIRTATMSKHAGNADDLNLCLTGLPVGTTISSSRSNNAKISRPGSTNQSISKADNNGMEDKKLKSDKGSASFIVKNARQSTIERPIKDKHDEFLAFFDSIKKPSSGDNISSDNISAEADCGKVDIFGDIENGIGKRRNFTHNVFIPDSARSNSTCNSTSSINKVSTPNSRRSLVTDFTKTKRDKPAQDFKTQDLTVRNKNKVAALNVGKTPNSQYAVLQEEPVIEGYIKRCNMSAVIIQRWFRRHKRHLSVHNTSDFLKADVHDCANEAAMRQLLESKRKDHLEQMKKSENKKDYSRKQASDDKIRLERLNAIQELHKKREEKRHAEQQISAEEISFLQKNGKVSKQPSTANLKKAKSIYSLQHGFKSNFVSEQNEPEAKIECSLQTEQIITVQLPNNDNSDKSTIEDLLETLRKLEEEDLCINTTNSDSKHPLSWLDELEKDKDNESLIDVANSIHLTDTKMNSIMNYLDKVETTDRLEDMYQHLEKANSDLEKPAILVPSSDDLAQLEQASLAASEVTHQMLSLKLELEEHKRTVIMLRKALNQQRELTIRHAQETEKEMKKRQDVLKQEHVEAVKRHNSFIDQLIDDKKVLQDKFETVTNDLKSNHQKYQDMIKSLRDNHEVEIKRLKDYYVAQEKLKREKWIEKKTKEIHEITVRGLEPDIQRLVENHKLELKKMKSIHEADLLASDERAGQRYIKMTEELRDQLAKEKEAACARERELARQTYEKQLMQEEEIYQQQRQRLYTEVKEEKERLAQNAQRQRLEMQQLQHKLEDMQANASEALKKQYEKEHSEQERRHITEVKQLREELKVERDSWEENYRKKQETWLLQRERELREQVKKERDKEIELVIQRLEADNQEARDECERLAENRIKRIRDKYESEMSELERSERSMTERYNQLKAKLVEVEGDNEHYKVSINQKEKDINELKMLLEKRNSERDHISDVIRQEFADKLVATDEENKRLKNEMSELKARQRVELERFKADKEVFVKAKEDEISEITKRVKVAVEKKDEQITAERQKCQSAIKRADHLEGLLEQQRKQLLGKK